MFVYVEEVLDPTKAVHSTAKLAIPFIWYHQEHGKRELFCPYMNMQWSGDSVPDIRTRAMNDVMKALLILHETHPIGTGIRDLRSRIDVERKHSIKRVLHDKLDILMFKPSGFLGVVLVNFLIICDENQPCKVVLSPENYGPYKPRPEKETEVDSSYTKKETIKLHTVMMRNEEPLRHSKYLLMCANFNCIAHGDTEIDAWEKLLAHAKSLIVNPNPSQHMRQDVLTFQMLQGSYDWKRKCMDFAKEQLESGLTVKYKTRDWTLVTLNGQIVDIRPEHNKNVKDPNDSTTCYFGTSTTPIL